MTDTEEKAKHIIDHAAETAKQVLEEARNEIPSWMQEHLTEEHQYHQKIDELIPTLATKKELKGLATEESIRELIHWQKNLIMAGAIVSSGGKWSKRALLALAAVIGSLGIIIGGWKVIWGFFFGIK